MKIHAQSEDNGITFNEAVFIKGVEGVEANALPSVSEINAETNFRCTAPEVQDVLRGREISLMKRDSGKLEEYNEQIKDDLK